MRRELEKLKQQETLFQLEHENGKRQKGKRANQKLNRERIGCYDDVWCGVVYESVRDKGTVRQRGPNLLVGEDEVGRRAKEDEMMNKMGIRRNFIMIYKGIYGFIL